MLLSMSEILDNVTKYVNKCLGPLGRNGMEFQWSDLRDILIQLIATLLLFIVIRIFVWKRITSILETRGAAIDKELIEAKEANRKARMLVSENQDKLDAAQQEIKKMLEKAEKEANIRRDEIITQAKEEAAHRLDNVEKEIASEISKKNAEIHQQIVDIAMLAAEKIVEHEIDHDKYIDVVNKIIEGANE